MKRKLTMIHPPLISLPCLQNTCRLHVVKTIKGIMSIVFVFGLKLSGLAGRGLRLAKKARARIFATPTETIFQKGSPTPASSSACNSGKFYYLVMYHE